MVERRDSGIGTWHTSLPRLYEPWMRALLGGPIPAESAATCGTCCMLRREDAPVGGDREYFNPRTKCCTFYPDLPNFLVGAMLQDRSAGRKNARAVVAARVAADGDLTPLGLRKPTAYRLQYDHDPTTWGQSLELRCPYYLEGAEGTCGIWPHRPAVCATWFCKHERGAVGERFWMSLKQLLAVVERALSVWCVLELGLDVAAWRALQATRDAVHNRVPRESARPQTPAQNADELFGEWRGRRTQLFRACADRVRGLGWDDVLAIGGAELRVLASLTVAAYNDLVDGALPGALSAADVLVRYVDESRVLVTTYSKTDPLLLPRELLELLPCFAGRSTADALGHIEAETGTEVDPELLRLLVDFGVLRPERLSR